MMQFGATSPFFPSHILFVASVPTANHIARYQVKEVKKIKKRKNKQKETKTQTNDKKKKKKNDNKTVKKDLARCIHDYPSCVLVGRGSDKQVLQKSHMVSVTHPVGHIGEFINVLRGHI